MNTIHQLIATHCTYGTSALERRKGEDADRVLGYSVRASSLAGGALAGWYRKIERLLYYYLPRDAAAEARQQLTAASAPKRLIYVPAIDDLEVLAQVCYRPTDTAGRTGSYFAHCLARQKSGAQDHWSVLDCLKLWAAPGWIEEDTPSLPSRVDGLSGLEQMLGGRRPAIDERVVLSFLTAAAGGAFDDPCGVIPPRWRQKSPAERRELLAAVLGGCLVANASPPNSLLLVAEPSLAALLFFGIIRLLPPLAASNDLSFSTFETDVDRRRFVLTATCFQNPDSTDLPPQVYKSGPALAVVNTYLNTRSKTPASCSAAAQALVNTLAGEGWDAVDRANRPNTAKSQTRMVDPYYEWLGIPPKDQPPNHYRLLGLELFEENRSVIDAAANRQMSFIKEYQAGADSELSQKLLNELSAARLCLLSAPAKAAYDEQLRAQLRTQAPAAPAMPVPPALRWRNDSDAPPSRAIPAGCVSLSPLTKTSSSASGVAGPAPVSLETRPRFAHGRPSGNRQQSKTGPNWLAVGTAIAAVVTATVAALLGFVVARSSGPASPSSDDAVAHGPGHQPADMETRKAKVSKTHPSQAPVPFETGREEREPIATTVATVGRRARDAIRTPTFSPLSEPNPEPTRSAEPVDPQLRLPTMAVPTAPKATQAVVPLGPVIVVESAEPVPASSKQQVVSPVIGLSAELRTTTAPPPPPPVETLEQADKRLQAAAEQASSSAKHQAVAQELLSLANKAIVDSQTELAKRVVERALAAARKSETDDLVKQATLLWSELQQPLTDEAKERARQRLRDQAP